jgi:tetratricopeptide (TPR) repeat protein
MMGPSDLGVITSNIKEKAAAMAAFSLRCALFFFIGSGQVAAATDHVATSSAESRLVSAWEKASALLFNEANAEFEALQHDLSQQPPSPHLRESRFGLAVTSLTLQPQTVEGLERARKIFSELIGENPDDRFAVESAYYLARITSLHEPFILRSPLERSKAAQQFREWLGRFADRPGGGRAASKAAMLLLSDNVSPEVWNRRWRECETWLSAIKDPGEQFDLRWAMAIMALQIKDQPALALPHLLVCAETPMAMGRTKANVWILAAEVASRLGHHEVAHQWWRQFIKEFPADDRVFVAQKRVEERER